MSLYYYERPEVGRSYKVKIYNICRASQWDSMVEAWGKCIWVHPKGRFALLQFPQHGNFRECFLLQDIGGIRHELV